MQTFIVIIILIRQMERDYVRFRADKFIRLLLNIETIMLIWGAEKKQTRACK